MTTFEEWKVAEPESAGLSGATLRSLIDWLDGCGAANVHSVVVARRGTLLFEHYWKGADQCWAKPLGEVAHGPDIKHDLRSVTKSVISLLVGIAIDRELISGVDEPVFKWFPEYADLRTPEKDRILLRHLLTMSAGLEWDENRPYTDPMNSEMRMLRSDDQLRFTLAQPIVAAPGEVWNYNSGATALLGAVLSKAAGRSLDDVARELLFEPVGISDFEWVKGAKSALPEVGGLRLRSRDMAKIGQLVVSGGRWSGRQVVPARWIAESTTAHIGPADRIYFYGYQWWLGRSLVKRREVTWVAAMGHGGQRVFAIPALDLVVVITAGLYNDPLQMWVPLFILNRYVLGALGEQVA